MPTPSDLVHETTTSTGSSDLTLVNEFGKRSFNTAFGTGGSNVFDYFISHRTAAEWERGTGHLSSSTVLVRDTVLASSNGGSAVNFGSGTKDATNDVPAGKQVVTDLTQTLTGKTINLSSNTLTGTLAEFSTAVSDANLIPESRTITSGDGLTGGGDLSANRTLAVGAGSGITVSADAVAVDTAVVALIATEDQTLTGGARVTVKDLGNLSGNTITPDPGDRPIQKITNNGSGTIAPGSNVGHYTLTVINASGAVIPTTSGWTKVDGAFDATTTSEFCCSCIITGDFSCMMILKVV